MTQPTAALALAGDSAAHALAGDLATRDSPGPRPKAGCGSCRSRGSRPRAAGSHRSLDAAARRPQGSTSPCYKEIFLSFFATIHTASLREATRRTVAPLR